MFRENISIEEGFQKLKRTMIYSYQEEITKRYTSTRTLKKEINNGTIKLSRSFPINM